MKATGNALNESEAYIFCIRNQNAVKILTRDHRSTSMVEVYDENAVGIKQECREFGFMEGKAND
ncbi:hypothetical protein [Pedobacter ginsengisoli]|uniref:hypothetical protein n=1 Tax=Pedobacter ginsengisoli TaxID=363852 RepID=UPI00254F18C9|nr:hypothetical protein [Pedobacter ginsengisoli]